MGIRSDYKKVTTKECCYCDWSYKCRKGHPCKWYKKFIKKVVSNKGTRNKIIKNYEENY